MNDQTANTPTGAVPENSGTSLPVGREEEHTQSGASADTAAPSHTHSLRAEAETNQTAERSLGIG